MAGLSPPHGTRVLSSTQTPCSSRPGCAGGPWASFPQETGLKIHLKHYGKGYTWLRVPSSLCSACPCVTNVLEALCSVWTLAGCSSFSTFTVHVALTSLSLKNNSLHILTPDFGFLFDDKRTSVLTGAFCGENKAAIGARVDIEAIKSLSCNENIL